VTGKVATKFMPRTAAEGGAPSPSLSDWAALIGFGLVQWPWLLRSLSGGSKREKRRLLDRLELPHDALPTLGSWKADTALLHRIVDTIEERRPATVVELGAGATTLIAARALERNGGGRLISFEQHGDFMESNRGWLAGFGLAADLRTAALERAQTEWPGYWYALSDLPERIDLLIIDGPPWTIHPLVRGGAECLFDRLSVGGTVLLDDAARPGERVIAARWRRRWPGMHFVLDRRGTKGTLIGTRIA
jgi:predicted O-methyltransferase YrrM